MSTPKTILQSAKNNDSNKSILSSKDKKWLNERPTRLEVINYVNSLWEHNHFPVVTSYIQMSSMILQAILIDKGVCTGDEIKDITEKFVAEQQRRMTEDKAHEEFKEQGE